MGKMSLAWIDSQIEQEMERGNIPEAVRDLAALVTVRNHLYNEQRAIETTETVLQPTKRHVGTNRQANEEHARHDQPMPLDKETVMAWVDRMVDGDGVHGGKYSWHQAQQYALNKGITGHQRQLEFYAAMNAMYSDFHEAGKKFGVDRPEFYACLAKLFIEDPDAVDDKVSAYYHHVVKHDT